MVCNPKSLALISVFFAVFPVFAAETGHGRGIVTINGSILDAACAIDIESRDQTIEMTTVPMSSIERDGVGPEQAFSIQLTNCTLNSAVLDKPIWSHFQMTFLGSAIYQRELFDIVGDARGLGLSIVDSGGNKAIPGQSMPAQLLQIGDVLLNYRLRLEANHQHLKSGVYQASIRFKMDYY